ncbi:M23 family metallopeptidase [Oerskovia sp. NPDC060338]|uniref:M23 family metallopeptidase n=1 Tax=Oerskovia sp. NPDC060338 TaxID=3347100 RepID=UPI00365874C1
MTAGSCRTAARRVPSHGVDLLGERYAIDFVGVDERHRTAAARDWRTLVATEPPERFVAFGRPILAPADGVVAQVHDGEDDHAARRSQPALVPYALGAAGRLREGVHAVAGNHVTIALPGARAYVSLVHLRRGSLRVRVGDQVMTGQPLAECGNSGNSTQPHVHVQVADSLDLTVAQGVPVAFRDFREWLRGRGEPLDRVTGLPGERSVVEPLMLTGT